jgi:hypothetical protein
MSFDLNLTINKYINEKNTIICHISMVQAMMDHICDGGRHFSCANALYGVGTMTKSFNDTFSEHILIIK